MRVRVVGPLLGIIAALASQVAYADLPPGVSTDGLGYIRNDESGTVGDSGDGDARPTNGKRSKGGTTTCSYQGREVSCSTDAGIWSPTVSGWCRAMDPPPPKTDFAWNGNTDGAVYLCSPPLFNSADPDYGLTFTRWLPGAPALPPPDPEELAWRAVAELQLSKVTIATFPQATSKNSDSMGIVGFPVPVWADTSQTDLGSRTASASERGFTVSLTATLDKVVWDFGDGSQAVTCSGPGAPYTKSTLSPEHKVVCGYQSGYQKQGDYTITATAHWDVAWTGIGQSGTIEQELVSEEQLRVGEYQVVNVMPKSP